MVLPDSWTPSNPGVLTAEFYELIGGFSGWKAELIAVILLVVQAISINYIMLQHRIGDLQNQFPGLFYVLLGSVVPEMTHLSPALIANTFLIVCLGQITSIQKGMPAAGIIFNLGFWIAFSSLFAPTYLIFLIVGLAALNIHRGLIFSERLILISGAIVPCFLTATVYYYFDKLDFFVNLQFLKGLGWLNWNHQGSSLWIGATVLMGLMIILVLIRYGSFQYKKTIQIQKKINLLYWMLLTSGLGILFQPELDSSHLLAEIGRAHV